ncbi:MAG: pyridoxamine 5'-phosphate oxidase family protein [Deltaproteobacteria bacterium]|nr:pyridoxamine 5'-phosphate oxidase family protein [Deltaproteobacteria bacterium]
MLHAQAEAPSPAVQKVFDFIKSRGVYYLATTEGDQPRVRPFGTLAVFEGKIYFQTSKTKEVSKQLLANPKIEICAFMDPDTWIRVQAIAVEDDRLEAKRFILETHPELQGMYSADDDKIQVFFLKDATATLNSFSQEGWTETF